MSDGWDVVSNVASICGIIGLPIAVRQIYKIKSTTKAMKDAIHDFLSLEKISTLNKIFDVVTIQRNKLITIEGKSTKQGYSVKNARKECGNSIQEINTCIYNLQSELDDIEKQLCNSVLYLNRFLESEQYVEIKNASECLYKAIANMKKVKEGNIEFEIKALAK